MESVGLSPQEYDELDRWDRMALKYYSLVKNYYEWKQTEKMKNESKVNNPNTMNLPKMRKPSRGRN